MSLGSILRVLRMSETSLFIFEGSDQPSHRASSSMSLNCWLFRLIDLELSSWSCAAAIWLLDSVWLISTIGASLLLFLSSSSSSECSISASKKLSHFLIKRGWFGRPSLPPWGAGLVWRYSVSACWPLFTFCWRVFLNVGCKRRPGDMKSIVWKLAKWLKPADAGSTSFYCC